MMIYQFVWICQLHKSCKRSLFTGTPKPYNNSYFKGVWIKGRFPSVERDITLYSFRHTGAMSVQGH